MSYYFRRIFNNKIKLSVIILIFFLPVLDVIITLKDIHSGASALSPMLATFLGNCIFQGIQKLLLWFLPLLLSVIAADDCIEDYKLGYKNLLVSKWGKKKYIFINIAKSFVISFLVLLIPLVFNLFMTQIAFAGGTYNLYSAQDIKSNADLNIAFKNPMLTNIVYILLASVLSGVVTMGATAISISFHNRFIVYPAVFILWYIPSMINPPIMCAFQPFTDVPLINVTPAIFLVLAVNSAAIIFTYIKTLKYDQV